jgi:hypothetical protein
MQLFRRVPTLSAILFNPPEKCINKKTGYSFLS